MLIATVPPYYTRQPSATKPHPLRVIKFNNRATPQTEPQLEKTVRAARSGALSLVTDLDAQGRMSRHRRVRNMSYGDDDDYYEYGRSLEEDAPLSPNTAAQFMYRRDQQENHSLSSYFDDKETAAATTPVSPLATTATVASPQKRNEEAATTLSAKEGKVVLSMYV
jgi:hypothetical protein